LLRGGKGRRRKEVVSMQSACESKPWKHWRHITKLDPDREISEEDLKIIVESGTDAIMISGTQNVTAENVNHLVSMLSSYDIPKILEPSNPESIIYEGVDYVFVPSVLNADVKWLRDIHVKWIKSDDIRWDMIVPEAYIVLNPSSAVAVLTNANTALSVEDVVAYGIFAERFLRFPIVYIEYSGKFGDISIVRALREALSGASLFYGGGINSAERAAEMLKYADVIVVGNVVYEDMQKFMETVVTGKQQPEW